MIRAQEDNPKVGIVVLNYQNYSDTFECLSALQATVGPDTLVVVVDNASPNDSFEQLSQFFDRHGHGIADESSRSGALDSAGRQGEWLLVRAEENRGYAAGNNVGIREALDAGAEYVLILNADTVPQPGFLEPLLEIAASDERIGAVGPKVIDMSGRIQRACARRRPTLMYYLFAGGVLRRLYPGNRWLRMHTYEGEYEFDQPREVDVLSGCCMLLKSECLAQMGLLDETTFLYSEEFVLHEQLRSRGRISVIQPLSCVVHKGQGSTRYQPLKLLMRAGRDSKRYYLRHYRGYSRWTIATLLVAGGSPRVWIRNVRSSLSRR